MSADVDWTLYADGVCESLNRAQTMDVAVLLAAEGMAHALEDPDLVRCTAAHRIAAAYREARARIQGVES